MKMKEYSLHKALVTGGHRSVEVVQHGEVGAGSVCSVA